MTDAEWSADDLLAAEYVVGVLSADDRTGVQRRIAAEPAFAAEVETWEERLTPLLAEVPPETPPRVVWRRISAQLGVAPRSSSGLWNNIAVWRAAAGAFAVAAAAAVAVVVLTPAKVVMQQAPTPAQTPEITSVALLRQDTGPASFVVSFDREAGRMIITPIDARIDADRSFELWLLPDGQAPVSLGVVNSDKALILRPEQLVGPAGERGALAITVEPLGGSPDGKPTGPVIATGQLQPI